MIFSVTTSIFYKKISEFGLVRKPDRPFHDKWIENTQIWERDTVKESYMYLTDTCTLSTDCRLFHHCVILCAGNYDEVRHPVHDSCDLIICPEMNLYRLSNIIYSIQNQFRGWRNRLYDIILTTGTFESMFNVSHELLSMRFFLVDTEYICLGISNDFFGKKQTDEHIHAFVRELQDDGNDVYLENFHSTDIYVYDSAFLHGPLLMFNIFHRKRHRATLCIRTSQNSFPTADRQFIRYLGEVLSEHYDKYTNEITHDEHSLKIASMFSEIAEGHSADPKEASALLSVMGWMTWHDFQTIEFRRINRDDISFSLNWFCSQIERNFPSCIAFPHHDIIWCVRDLSIDGVGEMPQTLPYFLRENLCKAGVSNRCTNFMNLGQAFSQARSALILGEQQNSMLWCFYFKDFAFDYLRLECTREYPADQISHEALRLLKEHDSRKHTDYYTTLKTYLETGMNASLTADRLFIHRSTFLQRMGVIKKLTRIDLDDFQERTFLQLSFLLEEGKKQ